MRVPTLAYDEGIGSGESESAATPQEARREKAKAARFRKAQAPSLVLEVEESDGDSENAAATPRKAPERRKAPQLSPEDQRIASIVEAVVLRINPFATRTETHGGEPSNGSPSTSDYGRRKKTSGIDAYIKDKNHRIFLVRYLIANEGSNLRTLQSETRSLFKEKFNVDKDEEFALHVPPSRSDIEAFEEEGDAGTTDGPDPDNMKFDMEGGTTSLWNKKIFSYLVEQLSERCEDALLPDVSRKYIEYLVTEKYTRCRGYWQQAQPRVVHGNTESLERVEARMTQKKEQHMEGARHRERRLQVSQNTLLRFMALVHPLVHQKYNRRIQTLNIVLKEKAEEGEDDFELWKWLKEVILRLGVDGMSSEESDVDQNSVGVEVTIYRVKILAWRRKMEDELALIDQARKYAVKNGPRGTRPVDRRRSNINTTSSRSPVPGLPEVLYDGNWLSNRTNEYKELILKVSKEEFRWLRLKSRRHGRS
jgi:hypothetical protein